MARNQNAGLLPDSTSAVAWNPHYSRRKSFFAKVPRLKPPGHRALNPRETDA